VFVLVFAVPALLVVVVGYVIGYGLWTWLGGLGEHGGSSPVPGAEPAGWITGVLLLAAVTAVGLAWRRRRRRDRREA
jgi:hypothetical protein